MNESTQPIGAMLPVDRIIPNPKNPRHLPSAEKDAEMIASVAQDGILEPLLVRVAWPKKVDEPELYEIIAGHRRHRAATIAKLPFVPCVVKNLSDQAVLEHALIENLQRADLHPLDAAVAVSDLLVMDPKATIHDVADRIGKTVGEVNRMLSLTRLTAKARKLFLDDKIRLGGALALARLQPRDQDRCLKDLGTRDDLTERDVRNWTERHVILKLANAPFALDDAALLPAAGACVSCPKRSGNAPGLFEDVKGDDLCSDPACFTEKVSLYIGHRKAALESANPSEKVVLIAISDWISPTTEAELKKGGILRPEHDYREAPTGICDYLRRGVVAYRGNGPQVPPFGAVKRVCIAPAKCAVHKRRPHVDPDRPQRSEAEKAKDKRRAEAVAEHARVTGLKVRKLASASITALHEDLLRKVIRAAYDRALYDGQKAIAKAIGWDLKHFNTQDKYVAEQLDNIPKTNLLSFLLVITVADELMAPPRHGTPTLKTPDLDQILKAQKLMPTAAELAPAPKPAKPEARSGSGQKAASVAKGKKSGAGRRKAGAR